MTRRLGAPASLVLPAHVLVSVLVGPFNVPPEPDSDQGPPPGPVPHHRHRLARQSENRR